jgi:hypothetical protein
MAERGPRRSAQGAPLWTAGVKNPIMGVVRAPLLWRAGPIMTWGGFLNEFAAPA